MVAKISGRLRLRRDRLGSGAWEMVITGMPGRSRIRKSTGFKQHEQEEAARTLEIVLQYLREDVAAEEAAKSREIPMALAPIAARLREASFNMPDTGGVYVLLHGGEIQYVGRSGRLRGRIGEHMKSKRFDRALWMETEAHRTDIIEESLIALLRPPLNLRADDLRDVHWMHLERIGFRKPS